MSARKYRATCRVMPLMQLSIYLPGCWHFIGGPMGYAGLQAFAPDGRPTTLSISSTKLQFFCNT